MCLVNVTAASIHMDYCVISFTSPGKSCSFIVTDASYFTSCSEDSERSHRYTCRIVGLIPGETYVFEIISQTDGARLNITVQTGKTLTFLQSCSESEVFWSVSSVMYGCFSCWHWSGGTHCSDRCDEAPSFTQCLWASVDVLSLSVWHWHRTVCSLSLTPVSSLKACLAAKTITERNPFLNSQFIIHIL